MIIDITEVIINRKRSMVTLREWLDVNVGPYLGPGQGSKRIDDSIPARYTTLEIGEGWQIELKEIVDGYGKTVFYQLDINDEQLATFFILKFL